MSLIWAIIAFITIGALLYYLVPAAFGCLLMFIYLFLDPYINYKKYKVKHPFLAVLMWY